jgi:hypothetical protein
VLDGAPGGWPKFMGHWLLRGALIMPGLVIGGVRDKRVIPAALASSTMISLFLIFYTVVERGRHDTRSRRARGNLRSSVHGQRSRLHGKRVAQRSFSKR